MLAKNPGFTAVAMLTLALGIGATTVMFSIIECGVLDAFPYRDVHRLVKMVAHDPRYTGDSNYGWISSAELRDYQEQNHVFDAVFGQSFAPVLLTGRGAPATLAVVLTTRDFFRGFGLPALLGRALRPDDYQPGAPAVAVLVYDTWRSRFNGDPKIVGQTLTLNHQLTTVVGVMLPRFMPAEDIFLPDPLSTAKPVEQQSHFILWGRLKRGISVQQAKAEVAILDSQFAKLYPSDHPKQRTNTVDLLTEAGMTHQIRTLYFLMGAVCLLQLIACVNVANLLLARATTREKEVAIRASLGASRGRLIRQFLVESLLLALSGATLGALIAWKGLAAILAMIPTGVYFWPANAVIRINGPVLLFNLGLAIVSTALCGLAPALRAAGERVDHPLKESGQRVGESRAHRRLRNVLVANEVALALVLLTGAGLLTRAFLAMHHVELGYNPDNILVGDVALPPNQYRTREQKNQFTQELLRRVRALPGVTSAAVGFIPVGGNTTEIEITGQPNVEGSRADINLGSDRYFETLQIPLLQGRTISQEDFAHSRKVAVVNQAFMIKYLSGQSPVGHEVTVPELKTIRDTVQSPTFEIVGVVGNTKDYESGVPQPSVYLPQTILAGGWNNLLVRTVAKPTLMTNQVQREVTAIDKDLPLFRPRSMRDLLNDLRFAKPRILTSIMVVFAVLGLTLVSVGVYSVLSYSASQRRREIGIRMALGAQTGDVKRMVMLSSLKWVALGIAIGVPVSIALIKVFQGKFWAVKSSDPLTLMGVTALLLLVGLVASYVPARRATKVDPMVALRYE
jgi:predicted permease